jgi:SPP1 family predicted phage head-tail adaptor
MSLRDRILIERESSAPGPTGAPVKAWQPLCRPWAEVKGVSGRAFLAAGAEQSEVTFEIRMRYRADITAGLRVTHHGITLEIVAPLPDERRQWLRLMCKTVKP